MNRLDRTWIRPKDSALTPYVPPCIWSDTPVPHPTVTEYHRLYTFSSPIRRATLTVMADVSFLLFDRESLLTLAASLVGVTSLLFAAKGNPIGPALMVLFSILYGIISFSFSYYGEMMTYLGMTLPMSVFALGAWVRNPYEKGRAEVKVARLGGGDIAFMILSCAAVTAGLSIK